MEPIKPYKKDFSYSYALGAFPTYELLRKCPRQALGVYVHSAYTEREELAALCQKLRVPVWAGDKTIARVSDKENVFVVGVFQKYERKLAHGAPHLMLVQPSNMGNLGTILRTCLAMGIHDAALIRPAVDAFHPKAVRASMGALFSMRVQYFDSFAEYAAEYAEDCAGSGVGTAEGGTRRMFSFMLTGKTQLTAEECPKPECYTLIFGNEATGLPEEYAAYGESLLIPQSDEVDSLNLTIAVGIGTYLFAGAGRNGKKAEKDSESS